MTNVETNSMNDEWGTPELMTIVLGRDVEDYDFVACGAFTPLVLASGMWAVRHHAPNAVLLPISLSGTRVLHPFPISYLHHEGITLGAGLNYTMADMFAWGEGKGVDFEPIFPLQLDRTGAVNLSVLGPFERPTFRGPGAAGVDALSVMTRKLLAYCPRHSPRMFVDTVDFVTGIGNDREARIALGVSPEGGIGKVVTNLGVLEFSPEGPLEIVSVHPGVTVEEIQEQTGFPVAPRGDLYETAPPTPEELAVLEEIDPLGVRSFEFLSARERRALLPDLVRRECEYFDGLLVAQ
jgi:glutaconate CoA-transferase, subunit B